MCQSYERRVDDRGRVAIPREALAAIAVGPGDEVSVSLETGRVVVEPTFSREEFVEATEGCIDAESRDPDAPTDDPLETAEMWTDDLP